MPPSSKPIRVSNVMTSQVRTAEPSHSLQEVWQMLVDEHCHHMPILENGRPVGMISTRDLMRVAREHGAQKISAGLYGGETAGEIMTTELETIHADDPVEAAIDRIGIGDIHALVVLDDHKKFVGIVTNHDLLHYLIS